MDTKTHIVIVLNGGKGHLFLADRLDGVMAVCESPEKARRFTAAEARLRAADMNRTSPAISMDEADYGMKSAANRAELRRLLGSLPAAEHAVTT